MGTDALKELREWQRAQASEQDKALKGATRALAKLGQLEAERTQALATLVDAVAALEGSGVIRDQVAALLDVSPDELGRLLNAGRRSSSSSAGA